MWGHPCFLAYLNMQFSHTCSWAFGARFHVLPRRCMQGSGWHHLLLPVHPCIWEMQYHSCTDYLHHMEHEPTHRLKKKKGCEAQFHYILLLRGLYCIPQRDKADNIPCLMNFLVGTYSSVWPLVNARRTPHKLSMWKAGSYLESVAMWLVNCNEIWWHLTAQDWIWPENWFYCSSS